jgi:hypothetical protein
MKAEILNKTLLRTKLIFNTNILKLDIFLLILHKTFFK